jgi:hypothetical protein
MSFDFWFFSAGNKLISLLAVYGLIDYEELV